MRLQLRSTGDVLIANRQGLDLPAYVAVPSCTDRVPGVVVLHDVGGVSQDLRNQADWLAAAGFVAAAPNLYHRGGSVKCVRTIMRDCMARRGATFDDIDATRDWLARHERCNGRVGVIGFCMGGGIALLLVSGHHFSAASVNYGGRLPKDIDALLAGACPIVGSYGAKDRWNRGVAKELEQAMERAQVPHDVKEYPEAGHSFMNNKEVLWFKVLRFAGIAYDEQAAIDARARIIAFFRRHLQV